MHNPLPEDAVMCFLPHILCPKLVIVFYFREALDIQYDIIHILKSLEEEHQFPKISVELVDNDSSVIYAASKKSAHVSYLKYDVDIYVDNTIVHEVVCLHLWLA